jgi:transcriptional regulator with XRE-family HTH domain
MENPTEKQEKSPPPSVSIDGSKIRNIREEKKLTQLYVANVVGVTTDTISRWENNRYPSIKRENVEKLAAALEVDPAVIARIYEQPSPVVESPIPPGKKWSYLVPLLLVIISFSFAALYFLLRSETGLTAERSLPRFGAPGEIIPVQIRVTRPGGERSGFIIRERLPEGWILVASSPPATAGKGPKLEVKWLVPAGANGVTILYTARIGPDATLQTEMTIRGTVVSSADGSSRTNPVDGNGRLRIAGIHWADTNGDGRIDDDEIMPAYYLTEEMKNLGLDWKHIEAIWNAGGYRWDGQKKGFVIK